jgi:hypothetical protein
MDDDEFEVIDEAQIQNSMSAHSVPSVPSVTAVPSVLPTSRRMSRMITDYAVSRVAPYIASRIAWQAVFYYGGTIASGNVSAMAALAIIKRVYDMGLL